MPPTKAIERAKNFTTLDTAALVLVADHVGQELRQLVNQLRGPTAAQPDRLTVASILDGLSGLILHAQIHRPADVVLQQYADTLSNLGTATEGKGGGR